MWQAIVGITVAVTRLLYYEYLRAPPPRYGGHLSAGGRPPSPTWGSATVVTSGNTVRLHKRCRQCRPLAADNDLCRPPDGSALRLDFSTAFMSIKADPPHRLEPVGALHRRRSRSALVRRRNGALPELDLASFGGCTPAPVSSHCSPLEQSGFDCVGSPVSSGRSCNLAARDATMPRPRSRRARRPPTSP